MGRTPDLRSVVERCGGLSIVPRGFDNFFNRHFVHVGALDCLVQICDVPACTAPGVRQGRRGQHMTRDASIAIQCLALEAQATARKDVHRLCRGTR